MISAKRFRTNKAILSNWMIFFFFLTVGVSGAISAFFQKPNQPTQELESFQNLFRKNLLSGTTEIELNNRLGTFHFEKLIENGVASWNLTEPRRFAANQEVVQKIFRTLDQIKIRKFFEKDHINVSNFSLDNPVMTLTLFDEAGEKTELKVGLINPKYNTTYVSVSDQNAIYQIDALDYQIEALNLSDFVDSKIFTFDINNIASLKIYRGPRKSNNIGFHAVLKDGNWIGKKNRKLDNLKVTKFFRSLVGVRSLFILDKSSEKLGEELKKHLSRPLYTIEVEDKQKNYFNYTVTNVLPALPNVKMEKWKNFLITASNRKHPYLVSKDLLKIFAKSDAKMRSLQIRKLFY